VPYGYRKAVDVVTVDKLLNASMFLQGVEICVSDFNQSLTNVVAGDLIFLDPPYTVAHENNGFIEYNQKLFSWEDQIRLRNFIKKIEQRGAYFIMTNASHKSILSLYSNLGSTVVKSRYSQVGGRNKTRGLYNELIVTNTNQQYVKNCNHK